MEFLQKKGNELFTGKYMKTIMTVENEKNVLKLYNIIKVNIFKNSILKLLNFDLKHILKGHMSQGAPYFDI